MSENGEIYRDSLSAWNGLTKIGGLEPSGRNEDLVNELRGKLDPEAEMLNSALLGAPVTSFIQALFQVIQPLPLMFGDVLRFFERAGAREGQTQWRVVVGEEVAELCHFEEFLEQWRTITSEFEVQAIGGSQAFLPHDVRHEMRSEHSARKLHSTCLSVSPRRR